MNGQVAPHPWHRASRHRLRRPFARRRPGAGSTSPVPRGSNSPAADRLFPSAVRPPPSSPPRTSSTAQLAAVSNCPPARPARSRRPSSTKRASTSRKAAATRRPLRRLGTVGGHGRRTDCPRRRRPALRSQTRRPVRSTPRQGCELIAATRAASFAAARTPPPIQPGKFSSADAVPHRAGGGGLCNELMTMSH